MYRLSVVCVFCLLSVRYTLAQFICWAVRQQWAFRHKGQNSLLPLVRNGPCGPGQRLVRARASRLGCLGDVWPVFAQAHTISKSFSGFALQPHNSHQSIHHTFYDSAIPRFALFLRWHFRFVHHSTTKEMQPSSNYGPHAAPVLKRRVDDAVDYHAPAKRFRQENNQPRSVPSSPDSPIAAFELARSNKKDDDSPTRKGSRPNMSASNSITLEMLRPHFEKPLAQVAKVFGICVTLLKKICRKHGISRWPHRQITGLRKSIASMEHAIGYFEGSRRDSYAEQLHKQKVKLAALLEDPTKCNSNSEIDDERYSVSTASSNSPPSSPQYYQTAPAPLAQRGVVAASPNGPLGSTMHATSHGFVSAPRSHYNGHEYTTAIHSNFSMLPSFAKLHSVSPSRQIATPGPSYQRAPVLAPASAPSPYFRPQQLQPHSHSGPQERITPVQLPPLHAGGRSLLPPISSLMGQTKSSAAW